MSKDYIILTKSTGRISLEYRAYKVVDVCDTNEIIFSFARVIRFPIDIRGRKYISFGKSKTGGGVAVLKHTISKPVNNYFFWR
jgi:hypothetical protein